ncbi:hypothetical protein SacmaDRAFT_0900 [Saccharomonospora marina XMU15]|uniref:DUF1963 domain-containing protein n=1 Tax=Saccharomonospora marina XMU15 TaxID=882083 RepID=H5X991_9PSEU|nr:YwqG family protein [Saccharomonospora marina]EHR49193.1 hypothetical protein SacmaDRAFT_0900 [Saccharomonospora marina XMU15]
MRTGEARLVATARKLLPPAVAARWIALIRPALRLSPAYGNDTQVGQLGGVPVLPEGMGWPVWEGQGPLNFVASIDCGRLPRAVLDLPLPTAGTLNFFFFDDEPGTPGGREFWRKVGGWEPESLVRGSRVIYTPTTVPASERSTPGEIAPYDFVPLTAKPTMTGPDWLHPDFRAACADLSESDNAFAADWANRDALTGALHELTQPPRHQLGGHALPVQVAVELDVARADLGIRSGHREPSPDTVNREASRWTLLAQIDFDGTAEMAVSDLGRLYWLIRTEDLAARKFWAASFIRQE